MDGVAPDVLVVGAGHAGVHVAVALAKLDPAPAVTILGEEACLPYERPPLTKRLLYGESEPEAVPLRSADYWERSTVRLRTGSAVVRVDAARRTVRTADGESIGYGTLVWAAGGRAAPAGLPGDHLAGVHSIRGLGDLVRLRADLAAARSAVIIGGGYVGLEVASALKQLGLDVTLVEHAPRILARVSGPLVSQFFTALHRSRGVDIRVGVGVQRIVARDGRAGAVRLADGTELPADVVVVGVGMRPEVAALIDAGARGDRGGVEIDAACRTSLPDVYAIGDCAKQVSPWSVSDAAVRIESVHNASVHAAAVARAMSGRPAADPPPPRFWSTQFGHELRTVGLPALSDRAVLRGDLEGGRFSVAYLRDGELTAIDTLERARDFARAQALVAAHWRPADLDQLTNPELDLPRPEPAAVR